MWGRTIKTQHPVNANKSNRKYACCVLIAFSLPYFFFTLKPKIVETKECILKPKIASENFLKMPAGPESEFETITGMTGRGLSFREISRRLD
jgi:hypothetical protein